MSGTHQIIRPIVIRHVENEDLSSAIDGVNVNFITAFRFDIDSVQLYLNGMRLQPGSTQDYTTSNNELITLNEAPLPGDVLMVDYMRFLPNSPCG